ncbi:hypothetical protein ACSSWA_14780 [Melioribacter sp. Ez-97]|jgi:hypothetical protein
MDEVNFSLGGKIIPLPLLLIVARSNFLFYKNKRGGIVMLQMEMEFPKFT